MPSCLHGFTLGLQLTFTAEKHAWKVNWDNPRMQMIGCLCLYVLQLWVGCLSRVSPNLYRNKQVSKMGGWIVRWSHVQNKVPRAQRCKTALQHDGYNLVFNCGNCIIRVECHSLFFLGKLIFKVQTFTCKPQSGALGGLLQRQCP